MLIFIFIVYMWEFSMKFCLVACLIKFQSSSVINTSTIFSVSIIILVR